MSDELSPDARSIIDAGRAGDDPTEADRARVRAALMISLAGGAGAAAAAAGASKSTWTAAALAKLLAGLTVAGAVVGVISIALTRGEAPAAVQGATGAGFPAREVAEAAGSLAPSLLPSSAPQALAGDVDETTSSASSGAARGQSAPRPAASISIKPSASAGPYAASSTLEDETKKLRAAHAAMLSGDPERAIALLEEQSTAYARGELRQERAAARVLALCQAGRAAEASAEAARFLRENPTSPLADRVRASCASPARAGTAGAPSPSISN